MQVHVGLLQNGIPVVVQIVLHFYISVGQRLNQNPIVSTSYDFVFSSYKAGRDWRDVV